HDARLLAGEHARLLEPVRVGARPGDVVDRQPAVEREADREGEELGGRLLAAEAALPEGHPWPCFADSVHGAACLAAQVSTPRPQRRTTPSASSCRERSAAS